VLQLLNKHPMDALPVIENETGTIMTSNANPYPTHVHGNATRLSLVRIPFLHSFILPFPPSLAVFVSAQAETLYVNYFLVIDEVNTISHYQA